MIVLGEGGHVISCLTDFMPALCYEKVNLNGVMFFWQNHYWK